MKIRNPRNLTQLLLAMVWLCRLADYARILLYCHAPIPGRWSCYAQPQTYCVLHSYNNIIIMLNDFEYTHYCIHTMLHARSVTDWFVTTIYIPTSISTKGVQSAMCRKIINLWCEKPVMSLRSNFRDFNFRGDSHGWKNSWVEIFVTCRLTTKNNSNTL